MNQCCEERGERASRIQLPGRLNISTSSACNKIVIIYLIFQLINVSGRRFRRRFECKEIHLGTLYTCPAFQDSQHIYNPTNFTLLGALNNFYEVQNRTEKFWSLPSFDSASVNSSVSNVQLGLYGKFTINPVDALESLLYIT